MGKRVKDICLKRGRRGFTLVELVAVMGILAILVAIVAPAAINSERASISAQAQADSPAVRNAATDFFARANESELRTSHTVTLTTAVNGLTVPQSAQVVSSRWPEMFIAAGSNVPTLSGRTANSNYSAIFETGTGPKVTNVALTRKTAGVVTTISGSDVLTKFTAIDLQKLVSQGLLNKMPDGIEKTSATGVGTLKAPNFLWLFKKQSSSLGTDDDRAVTVFLLVKVEPVEPTGTVPTTPTEVKLTYEQILGP